MSVSAERRLASAFSERIRVLRESQLAAESVASQYRFALGPGIYDIILMYIRTLGEAVEDLDDTADGRLHLFDQADEAFALRENHLRKFMDHVFGFGAA